MKNRIVGARNLKILFVMFFISILMPQEVFAYIDPGTGSMITQTIIAIFTAFICTGKIWYSKVLNLFTKSKGNEKNGD